MIFNFIGLVVLLFIIAELLLRFVKYLRTGKWEIFALQLEKEE